MIIGERRYERARGLSPETRFSGAVPALERLIVEGAERVRKTCGDILRWGDDGFGFGLDKVLDLEGLEGVEERGELGLILFWILFWSGFSGVWVCGRKELLDV